MYQANSQADAPALPPGVCCPLCGHGLMTLGRDDRDRQALTCACCRALVRLVQRRGDATSLFDLADREAAGLLPGGWWIVMAKTERGWLPVALAAKVSDAYDAALTSNVWAPLCLMQTDPPRRPEQQAELPLAEEVGADA
jgi:hypothetical protein